MQLNSEAVLRRHPIDLYRQLDAAYGSEPWLDWETDTVTATVFDTGPEAVDPVALDKLLAVQAVGANATLATTHAAAFENTVNAFCNNACVVDALQPPEIEEVCYAVRQIAAIVVAVHGLDEAAVVFSGEVPGYVAAVAKYRSWVVLPRRLGFAQEFLYSLLGVREGTPRWKENRALLAAAREAAAGLGDGVLDPGDLTALESGLVAPLLRQLIRALLYDPTKE